MKNPSMQLGVCALLVGFVTSAGWAQYKDMYQAGQTRQRAGQYAEARQNFAEALKLATNGEERAAAQIAIGLTYYAEQDYERAKPELQKVLTIPGVSAKQTHEAMLRLRLRKLIPGDEKFLTVLFIGASHQQVWNIPQIVETLAASASSGKPRIITGEFLRGGTMMNKFWEEGAGPDTARAKIAADPWDFVALDAWSHLGHDNLSKYGTLFVDLVRSRNATAILFETPPTFKEPYPDSFQKWHDEITAMGNKLKIAVAPGGYAWMKYLGPTPTPEQRMALYRPDAVHTSKKGAYMLACSVYSAITGCSPVGLTHEIPSFGAEGLTELEAKELQEAAWQAFLESNPELKPAP